MLAKPEPLKRRRRLLLLLLQASQTFGKSVTQSEVSVWEDGHDRAEGG